MSDGGPQYVSFVFKQFAQSYRFQHIVSSPRYAQSTGLAERGVQTTFVRSAQTNPRQIFATVASKSQ
jgi:hypothetical protein